jgi:hypothetical protein
MSLWSPRVRRSVQRMLEGNHFRWRERKRQRDVCAVLGERRRRDEQEADGQELAHDSHQVPPVPRLISAWLKLLNGNPLVKQEATTRL